MSLPKSVVLAALIFSFNGSANTLVEELGEAVRSLGQVMQEDLGYQISDQAFEETEVFAQRIADIIDRGLTREEFIGFLKGSLLAGWTQEEIAREGYMMGIIGMLPEELPEADEGRQKSGIDRMRSMWPTILAMAVAAETKMYTVVGDYDNGGDIALAQEAWHLPLSAERLGSAALLVALTGMFDIG